MAKLTARGVATAKAGTHGDGDGLYLVAAATGAKKWVFRFYWGGKPKQMGLGSAAVTGLAEARDLAYEARKLVGQGVNPIEAKRKAAKVEEPPPPKPNFGECAEAYITAKAAGWRNDKHVAQWRMTLLGGGKRRVKGKAVEEVDYCAAIRDLPVDQIGTDEVLAVLEPVWSKKPETASRLRGRIEAVLDAAKVSGHRAGENPAAWRGHLEHKLAKRQKLMRGHHAALDYEQVPAFMTALRERESMAALALEIAVLCACRTSEVLNAEHSEFDLEKKIWTIPAARMKAGREHRIPLSDRAVEIVAELAEARTSKFVFPGQQTSKPLSNMAMSMQLRRMGLKDITTHGFRSSFRDWSGETTSFPREVIEHALAHRIPDKAEAAYARGTLLEKRRALMEAWAVYCEPHSVGNVVALGGRK